MLWRHISAKSLAGLSAKWDPTASRLTAVLAAELVFAWGVHSGDKGTWYLSPWKV